VSGRRSHSMARGNRDDSDEGAARRREPLGLALLPGWPGRFGYGERTGSLGMVLGSCLTGSAILAATLYRLIVTGRLRRRSLPHTLSNTSRNRQLRAARTNAQATADGVWHYGVLFYLPSKVDSAALRKCSELRTWSFRRGPVQSWTLRPFHDQAPVGGGFLLIPRSWLILNGFLSPAAIVWPTRRFPLRDEANLLGAFWLELPGDTPPTGKARQGH
jgi:hypothetical protein